MAVLAFNLSWCSVKKILTYWWCSHFYLKLAFYRHYNVSHRWRIYSQSCGGWVQSVTSVHAELCSCEGESCSLSFCSWNIQMWPECLIYRLSEDISSMSEKYAVINIEDWSDGLDNLESIVRWNWFPSIVLYYTEVSLLKTLTSSTCVIIPTHHRL